ncbi:unnamed protein product [Peniophora sp. CBMAI 1063]|nr:unnamed protein product [Peniophora sp. CBMAI 1063]
MTTSDSQFTVPTDDEVVLYHQVWRALQAGSATRPPVPSEILLHIAAFAGWVLPYHVQTVSTDVHCYAYGGDKAEKLWFTSGPLADEDVQRIAAIQLVTVGRDQGWASDPSAGSWSWFEVGFERPPSEGSVLKGRRESHRNRLCSQEPTMCEGPLLPAPIEDWKAGDVVSVWACAQYPGWRTSGSTAELRFYKSFEPAFPPSEASEGSAEVALQEIMVAQPAKTVKALL